MGSPTMVQAVLEARLEGMEAVELSAAQRIVANAGFRRGGPEIARTLRSMGFVKHGWGGTGYDRTPLYRRVQP